MLYLGCHLWMKLLKLSIQSIILLYQLLVREHRKKSRLRSAASQLFLGLALSHDYVSKNSSAFTWQTLFKRCYFLPTKINQFDWKHKNLFCIKRKIFPVPPYTIWFPWSPQELHPNCLSPLDARRTEITPEELKHQKVHGCSSRVFPRPQRHFTAWEIAWVSTFSWLARSVSQVWDGPGPPHSTTHVVSLQKLLDDTDQHTVSPHSLFYFPLNGKRFTKAAFQGYYCISIGTKWEEKNPNP